MSGVPARTAPDRPADGASPSGLSDAQIDSHHDPKNINDNTNNANRLQNVDSTETGADHRLRRNRGTSRSPPNPGRLSPVGAERGTTRRAVDADPRAE
jgi:hypothetical protein